MLDLTEEQMKNMPYMGDVPADSMDVAKEMKTLMAVVASACVGYGRGNPRGMGEMLEDATKEPGQTILLQQTRLALALESWSAEGLKFAMTTCLETVGQIVGEQMTGLPDV